MSPPIQDKAAEGRLKCCFPWVFLFPFWKLPGSEFLANVISVAKQFTWSDRSVKSHTANPITKNVKPRKLSDMGRCLQQKKHSKPSPTFRFHIWCAKVDKNSESPRCKLPSECAESYRTPCAVASFQNQRIFGKGMIPLCHSESPSVVEAWGKDRG